MRTDQWAIYVSVESSPGRMTKIQDPFDKLSGGDSTASETKYKAGAMVPERTLGGTASVGNVTAERLYDVDRDHDLARVLAGRVGKARMQVTKQPLNTDGIPTGSPQIYTGVLMTVNFPDADSTSTSASVFQLVCSTDGRIG